MSQDQYIFSPDLLEGLIPKDLDSHLKLRPLMCQDYSSGFLELLAQLTNVGTQDESAFKKQFAVMRESKVYFIVVIEDVTTKQVIATTTLFLEYKFIHSNGIRGRIEDVVVDDKYRGKRVGKTIIGVCVDLSRKLHCYKISLDCKDSLIDFYGSLGFIKEPGRGNMLVQRFSE
jgi:glucosamine-phosphate N-acetyltransferase